MSTSDAARPYTDEELADMMALKLSVEEEDRLFATLDARDAELAELRERACEWFNGDGTTTKLEPEQVIERRKAAAKDLASLRLRYREAVRGIEVLRVKFIDIAGPNDIVLAQFDPKLNREWWQRKAIDGVKWCEAILSTPEAQAALQEGQS